jgi:hypothetical protein
MWRGQRSFNSKHGKSARSSDYRDEPRCHSEVSSHLTGQLVVESRPRLGRKVNRPLNRGLFEKGERSRKVPCLSPEARAKVEFFTDHGLDVGTLWKD